MSSKLYVLDGAMVECNQGLMPAQLMVAENKKVKIQGKFKATDMDLQVPQTFGQCKLKPSSGGYLPCIPALQKWTKTSQSTTLGTSKKFLFEDSECMCGTGGTVTILQHMQIDNAGGVVNELSSVAEAIPGPMLGNDNAPKVIECYWMDTFTNEKITEIQYGDQAAMFVKTENIAPGQSITIHVMEKSGKNIDGQQSQLSYTGVVEQDGMVALTLLETQEDWNKEE